MDGQESGGIARRAIRFVAGLPRNGILKVLGYCGPKGPGRAASPEDPARHMRAAEKKPKKSGETLYRIEF